MGWRLDKSLESVPGSRIVSPLQASSSLPVNFNIPSIRINYTRNDVHRDVILCLLENVPEKVFNFILMKPSPVRQVPGSLSGLRTCPVLPPGL